MRLAPVVLAFCASLLLATATFTPKGGKAISAKKSVTLRR
jgi:hypothetical protein